ncbi:M24 family metallopeptidase [Secundilactobacillus paracollinoides]|uniref:M24 family metallopeptidase n=1 Tax=Secundilactobacillus paracollinoides TaxID=240427 RepID=UPI00081A30C6|nr:aminopeptidase P family protein [Secundilactobacillus paracollinoides]ANZ62143.1 Xaa-Pro aminopeptidase [Secundilactobacillus paracollinoides]
MQARIKQLQAKFDDLRIDGFLVTNAFNLKYLMNFDGLQGDGVAVVTATRAFLITDARYDLELRRQHPDYELMITRNYLEVAAKVVAEQGVTVLGFEDDLPYFDYDQIDDQMSSDIVPLTGIIDQLRWVKDADELSALRIAAELTSDGLMKTIDTLHAGQTEREVANQLDATMRQLGATGESFATIVASGYRSALPHGAASDKTLQNGELVTIDCGYYFDGYTSDITRTVAVGDPGAKLKEIYTVVQTAQQRIIDAVHDGVSGRVLDQVGRELITQAGYGPAFNHGTGHGIGLDIHEGPALSARSTDTMHTNNVITVEPGIYLTDLGGVRIEDDVLVQPDSGSRLTPAPRDLIIV